MICNLSPHIISISPPTVAAASATERRDDPAKQLVSLPATLHTNEGHGLYQYNFLTCLFMTMNSTQTSASNGLEVYRNFPGHFINAFYISSTWHPKNQQPVIVISKMRL
jgi:hypothetical protein